MKPFKRLCVTTIAFGWFISALFQSVSANSVVDHIEAAKGYMVGRQYDYAGHEWRQALDEDPKNLEATVGLADALMNGGFPKEAIALLIESRKTIKEPLIDLTLARAYQKNKNLMGANNVYLSMLQKDPYNPDVFREALALTKRAKPNQMGKLKQLLKTQALEARAKGDKALATNNYAEAARYYEAASIYLRKISVANDYGLSLLLSGQNARATQQFALLTNQNTKSWVVDANAALVYLSLGKISQATTEMEQAINRCKNPQAKAKLYNNLGYVYEGGKRYLLAQHAYEHALQLNPSFTKAKMNLAYVILRQKDYEKAAASYKTLAEQNSGNADVWNRLGYAYEMMDEEKKALEAYKRATDINPRMKEAYFNLGALYKKMDKLTDSADAYKRVSEIEFQEMENPQLVNEPQGFAKVLSYVDVFYSKDAS